MDGQAEIANMMKDFRENPPAEIDGSAVYMIKDYLHGKSIDLKNNTTTEINLPKSDVLQFFTTDECKITVRPSGTEPKIKFYFSIRLQGNDESAGKSAKKT